MINLQITDFEKEYTKEDDYSCHTYTGNIELNGESVDISLDFENSDEKDHAEFIATVTNANLNWMVANEDKIRQHIAEKMTELAGEWLQDGEDEISIENFKERIQLYAYSSYMDKDFQLWFYDDDIFGGHDISLDIREGYIMDEEPSI